MLPVIYVAGPYRGSTVHRVVSNIFMARAAALEVWKAGAVALCPHTNAFLYDGESPDEVWLAGDLELMRRCDAVVMVPGWEASVGATAERQLATELRMPVFYGVASADMLAWIENWKHAHTFEVG